MLHYPVLRQETKLSRGRYTALSIWQVGREEQFWAFDLSVHILSLARGRVLGDCVTWVDLVSSPYLGFLDRYLYSRLCYVCPSNIAMHVVRLFISFELMLGVFEGMTHREFILPSFIAHSFSCPWYSMSRLFSFQDRLAHLLRRTTRIEELALIY